LPERPRNDIITFFFLTFGGIGYGSALSDYLGQAYMTQIVKPKPTDVVLEIGTGSGFQIALLSRIVKTAYSIEIITALGKSVQNIFAPLGYTCRILVSNRPFSHTDIRSLKKYCRVFSGSRGYFYTAISVSTSLESSLKG